jgi:retron-type reverse transcriptase
MRPSFHRQTAHQAVSAAQALIASGRRIVVDLDIEKFFDRVNHDERVMASVERFLERYPGRWPAAAPPDRKLWRP